MTRYEYKVVVYSADPTKPQFPGNTKVDVDEFSNFLNNEGNEGWEVISVSQESRYVQSLFQHEDYVIVMKREIDDPTDKSQKKKKK